MDYTNKHERKKDRLLDNCSEAIKQLQMESCQFPDAVFTGDMWQVKEFCSRMDRTFSHGLKRKAGGYWLFVRDLSHKSVVTAIETLPNVKSNVDRGYAWLYLSINDHTLESYLRAVIDHSNAVKSAYLTHALLRDSQRLQLLIMMVSGLEHLPLRLNWNDALKCKRDSIVTMTSESGCDSDVEEAECASLYSYGGNSRLDDQQCCDEDDPEIGAITIVHFDPETGRAIKFTPEDDVVHSYTRVTRKRKKEKSVNNNVNSFEEVNATSLEEEHQKFKARIGSIDRERFLESILNNRMNEFPTEDSTSEVSEPQERSPTSGKEMSVYDRYSVVSSNSKEIFETTPPPGSVPVEEAENKAVELIELSRLDLSERGVPEGQEDPMITSANSANLKLTALLEKSTLNDSWLPFSPLSQVNKTVAETNSAEIMTEIKNEIVVGKEQQKHRSPAGEIVVTNNFLLVIMLEVMMDQDEKVYKVYRGITGHAVGSPLEINIVLTDQRLYMIRWNEVTKHYDVVSAISHSEIEYIQLGLNGQFLNIVCVSPRRRYWISTGDEEVTRNIVSSLEVSIRRNSRILNSALPSVYAQATMQTIAIRKWVAEQISLDYFDTIQVHHYVFVRWEDPHVAQPNTSSPPGPAKEGFLMYHYTGSKAMFGTEVQWRAAYFRLQAGIFYHFNDSQDVTFRNYFQLVNGECVGCRHLQKSSRPYTFEILLSEGRTLRMAASSEEEASEWLQVVLQSVAQGNFGEEVKNPCVSACTIMASDHLFICQEQLETNTFSLLTKAQLQDVAAVYVDVSSGSYYCIMEFESVEATESNGDWVLYFASENELEKFLNTLKREWSQLYKVPLAINHILDPDLQKRFCSSQNFYSWTSGSPYT